MRPSAVLAMLCAGLLCQPLGADDTGALRAALDREAERLLDLDREATPPAVAAAGATLCERLAAGGTDLLTAGAGWFDRLEREAAAQEPAAPRRLVRHETASFVFVATAGSRAEADSNLIGELAERVLAHTATLLDAPVASVLGGGHVSTPLPGAEGEPERRPKIVVTLHPSTRGEPLDGRMGITRLGATMLVPGEARFTLRIDLAYLGPLSLAVLAHEVGHAATLLALLRTEELGHPGNDGELRAAFGRAYPEVPPFILEALGDHALYYGGFYDSWGAMPDPAALAFDLVRRHQVPPLADLLTRRRPARREDHKAISLAGATLVEYLRETQGPVGAWARAVTNGDAAAATTASFRLPPDLLDAAWRGWLAAHPGGCPTSGRCETRLEIPGSGRALELPPGWCAARFDATWGGASASWRLTTCGELDRYRRPGRAPCGLVWIVDADSTALAHRLCRAVTGHDEDDGCWESAPYLPNDAELARERAAIAGGDPPTGCDSAFCWAWKDDAGHPWWVGLSDSKSDVEAPSLTTWVGGARLRIELTFDSVALAQEAAPSATAGRTDRATVAAALAGLRVTVDPVGGR